MTIGQAIFLGMVQGITEFLPVSSSGHLVLLQNWMQIYPPPFYFDIFVHLVSVVVIIYYFRKTIVKIDKKNIFFIIIATLPLVIVGLAVRNHIKPLFYSNLITGFALIMTAVFNFVAAKKFNSPKNDQALTEKKSFFVGLTQAIALIPGVSRSGSTLFGVATAKINKKTAFEFSFLIAIPAILIASFGELILLTPESVEKLNQISIIAYLVGGIVCFFTSLASLKFLRATLNKSKYHYFGWYCLILGILAILTA